MRIALISSICLLSVLSSGREKSPPAITMRNLFNFLSISWPFIFSHLVSFLFFVHTLPANLFLSSRRNDNAEFFHHIERFPEYITSRFQLDSNEHLGWRVHVLHLCIALGIRLCQLRGKEASDAQCRLSSGRESRNSGKQITVIRSHR